MIIASIGFLRLPDSMFFDMVIGISQILSLVIVQGAGYGRGIIYIGKVIITSYQYYDVKGNNGREFLSYENDRLQRRGGIAHKRRFKTSLIEPI